MGWGQFKPLLAETAVAALEPIQKRLHELMDDRTYLEELLKKGNEKAGAIAAQTLTKGKDSRGFSVPL
jgi:tryptophanyl-tRNA synthetase